MASSQNWTQAKAALDGGLNASRAVWRQDPDKVNWYLVEDGTQIKLVKTGVAINYAPTAGDIAATDWITGPGKPPVA